MGKYTIRLDWPTELQVAAELVTKLKLRKKRYKKMYLASASPSGYYATSFIESDKELALAKDHFSYLLEYYQEHGTVPTLCHDDI